MVRREEGRGEGREESSEAEKGEGMRRGNGRREDRWGRYIGR